jgi:molecular chaperone DnaK
MGIWDRGRLRNSVGIETKYDHFTSLIPKGTKLPFALTESFTTGDLNQTSLKIKALQGESTQASANKRLGSFEVVDIPPGAPGATKIYITFHLDAHGSLRVSAKDYGTGRDLPVVRS